MLVKITDADDLFVEELKAMTGKATASKAFLHAAHHYQNLITDVADQAQLITLLESRLSRALAVIEGARSAAALLLDRTSQAEFEL